MPVITTTVARSTFLPKLESIPPFCFWILTFVPIIALLAVAGSRAATGWALSSSKTHGPPLLKVPLGQGQASVEKQTSSSRAVTRISGGHQSGCQENRMGGRVHAEEGGHHPFGSPGSRGVSATSVSSQASARKAGPCFTVQDGQESMDDKLEGRSGIVSPSTERLAPRRHMHITDDEHVLYGTTGPSPSSSSLSNSAASSHRPILLCSKPAQMCTLPSAASYPSASPMLPPPPSTLDQGLPVDPSMIMFPGPGAVVDGGIRIVPAIGQNHQHQHHNWNQTSVQESDNSMDWRRHTRVHGGGVCMACATAEDGGFYGPRVRPEDRRHIA